jgi:hypothetical protein
MEAAGERQVIAPSGGGKSGLQPGSMLANGEAGRPDGKCNRKQTAWAREGPGKGETVR